MKDTLKTIFNILLLVTLMLLSCFLIASFIRWDINFTAFESFTLKGFRVFILIVIGIGVVISNVKNFGKEK